MKSCYFHYVKAIVVAASLLLAPVAALAQIPGFDATMAKTQEVASDHIRWTGDVAGLEGLSAIVRKLLFVTEAPEASLGPLSGSSIEELDRK